MPEREEPIRNVALKEHFQAVLLATERRLDDAIDSLRKQINVALTYSERAVDKAEQAQALRNVVANEFRGQLQDQAATFITRNELTVALTSIQSKLDDYGSRLDRTEGNKHGAASVGAVVLAVVAMAISLLGIFLHR